MELRDFFKTVDRRHFVSMIESMIASQSQSEIDRTANEASRAIPLLADFLASKKKAKEEFDPDFERLWLGAALPLIAVYRIAEDMGYDWKAPHPPESPPNQDAP